MVFATQHPTDIETRIVGNCSAHLYGRANSPAAQNTVQGLLRQKGGEGGDLGRLAAGEFYASSPDADLTAPAKVGVPMSLSASPANPLTEAEILAKAERDRKRLNL